MAQGFGSVACLLEVIDEVREKVKAYPCEYLALVGGKEVCHVATHWYESGSNVRVARRVIKVVAKPANSNFLHYPTKTQERVHSHSILSDVHHMSRRYQALS